MRKALLIKMEEKGDKKLKTSGLMPPHERLDYLLELIRLSKGFKKFKGKITDSWAVNNFTLSRKA